jgi:hypothetical protein
VFFDSLPDEFAISSYLNGLVALAMAFKNTATAYFMSAYDRPFPATMSKCTLKAAYDLSATMGPGAGRTFLAHT